MDAEDEIVDSHRGARQSVPSALIFDLQRARSAVIEAELLSVPSERYLAAHQAALRTAAVVLVIRSARSSRSRTSARRLNAWRLLSQVAPELSEWASFFAATEGKREAVRSGAVALVSVREADDMVREAQTFLALVERWVSR